MIVARVIPQRALIPMKTLAVVLSSILVVGCAALAPQEAREPYEQKTYRTGSNLPVKDSDTQSRAKSGDAQSIQLPPNIQLPRGSGGG
jgi:hypothetical protein